MDTKRALVRPMCRWRGVLLLQRLCWTSHVTQALALCVLTFGVLLPLCCHRCLYSYYFLKSWYLEQKSDEALRRSYEDGQEALAYWRDVVVGGAVQGDVSEQPELLVTVVTARRVDGLQYHYLLQVMRRLDVLLQGCGDTLSAAVLVCDVESSPQDNEDAVLVEKRFRVVRRGKGMDQYTNVFEKEKRDYVFCLRQSMETVKPRNVVVLEDDALPNTDFFSIIRDLLSRRFILRSLYVKLYHPERLQRYWNPEPYRILEWVGLGMFGASTILLFLAAFPRFSPPFSMPLFLFLMAYIMVGTELIGRHYLLELRRVSPQLYAVSPATECCTPAMLFPGNTSFHAAELLDAATCMRGNAKDMVLYRHAGSAHSLEPNAIQHIGAFSSVRANPLHPQLL
ncbi:transmembrane protein 246 isoform X2 [Neoarius graeffei]|uniref:transmembrane protein 246 isoform X2 n=1 Tax=Neoarius graeffei TaxID=443677 RepID=UPI00298BCD11|nr:transmembrane protein 246 isoform X2 [Neoarius graeffei]